MNVKVDGIVVCVRSKPFVNKLIAVVFVFGHCDIEHFADFYLPVLIHWFASQLTYLLSQVMAFSYVRSSMPRSPFFAS